MKKLLIFLFLLPFALVAQKVNGVYTRAELTAQRPLQCSACLVQEGDSVWLFVRKIGSTAVAGPDVIVTTFGSIKLHKTKLAGAINLGSSNYYTKADVADLLSTRLKKASTLNHNAVPLYDGYNNEVQSSLLNQDGGNMGINKTFPEYRLDVSGVIHSDNALWVKDRPVATTLTNYVALYRGDGNIGQYLGRGYGLSDPFALYLGGGHRFYSRSNGPNFGTLTLSIDTTSRVGIRRTTPTYALDVAGTMRSDSTTYLAAVNGRVGIGTTNPLGALHLVSDLADPFFIEQTSATGCAQTIYKGTSRRFQTGVGGGSEVAVGVADKFFVYDGTAGAVRMVIDPTGKVGINTTNPSYQFEVAGTVAIRDGLGVQVFRDGSSSVKNHMYFANVANNRAYNWQLNSDGSAATFWGFTPGVGWNRLMTVGANGNVGVNTDTPTSKLHVVGIPEYASNAAAVSAGLTVGAFYHTGGTLKIVIP